MSESDTFAWAAWQHQFSVGPEMLSDVWGFYPEILPRLLDGKKGRSDQVEHGVPSDAFVQALLLAAELQPGLDDSFETYLTAREFEAANVLLDSAAVAVNTLATTFQRTLGQKQQAAEAEFAESRARLVALHATLENLGALPLDDPRLGQALAKADAYFERRRLGPAINVLHEPVTHLESQVQTMQAQLTGELAQLRLAIEPEVVEELRLAVIPRLDRAESYLAQGLLSLVQSELEAGRVRIETRDIAPPAETQLKAKRAPTFRSAFPYLTAQDIYAYVTDREGKNAVVQTHRIKEFNERWRPTHWRFDQQPAQQDELLQVLHALRSVSGRKARGPSVPFGGGERDHWATFLPRFFRILGKAGFEPVSAEPILHSKHDSSGYWLARCKPDLTVPFSFVTPERLRHGLALIIWNRSDSAACPTPANLAEELRRRGLSDEPLVVLAAREIPNDDDKRGALRSAIPTAALLDEHELLRIIFADDAPEERAAHFAQAVAWQLPPELASPYSATGDVPTSMFVGRDPILRDFLNPAGSSVLYGGRKLGKSSIFRQLQHRFVQRAGEADRHIAIYVHAIDVTDDLSISRRLLPRIAAELNRQLKQTLDATSARAVALPESAPARSSYFDAFVSGMDQLLIKLPEHRFLLLLDEADLLLQHLNEPINARVSPPQHLGWTLRRWIQDSGGRFDVRFAGFQEISRVSQYASGPFFNFGRGQWAHQLGVLEQDEAEDLVVCPLALLGVTFSNPSSIALILDYTGRHPALIQEFCSRLYRRVRGATRKSKYSVEMSQVEAVWQDRDFRKSVVLAIHLNVDTRRTKPEIILRLLLYVWVRQIMAGPGNQTLPLVAEPSDLYTLLTATFGSSAVEAHVQSAELDHYLADLAALGVLAKVSKGYVFQYRYFGRLLFYDHFGGLLNDTIVDEVWKSIVNHREELPRWQIQVGDEMALSPFTRLAQARLETLTDYIPLVLGAPGTGKSEFFTWLEASHEQLGQNSLDVRIVRTPATFDELRMVLANALDFGETKSWQLFAERALHWRKRSKPVLVVIDEVDPLVATDDPLVAADWSLIGWPNQDDRVREDDGLLFTLARIMRATKGELRFVLTGSFPLSRLWIEAEELLKATATPIIAQRLSIAERDAWFSTLKRPVATSEIKQSVWEITNGSFRLLRALRTWLRTQRIEELREEHLVQFKTLLGNGCDRAQLPELCLSLDKYDHAVRTTLRYLATLARDLGSEEEEATTWAEFLLTHAQSVDNSVLREWTLQRWLNEVRTAVLLQELRVRPAERDGAPQRVIVPTSDALFQFVVTSYEEGHAAPAGE